MHKIYENDDIAMYFKKRYCKCCGNVLQRKITERIVKKGDPDHKSYCSVGKAYKPYGDILVIGKEYWCPFCNKAFSCDEQGEIINAQKYYKKNIVTEEEINNVKNNNMLVAINHILKFRWFLLISIIGGLICQFYMFNGRLREKIKNGDANKLVLASIIVFIGVALLTKILCSIFINVEFIKNYQTLLMLIPSLLSFNLPTLWYIDHNFKK